MTLSEGMFRAASAARGPLGDAAAKVISFLQSRVGPNGGFRGRGAQEDLYYTAFGVQGLLALGAPPPSGLPVFLRGFGEGADLDLAHLVCLIRCWVCLEQDALPAGLRGALRGRLASFRAVDGGFNPHAGAECSTAYGCFLGFGALEDLGEPLPEPEEFRACLARFRVKGGAYSNEPGQRIGLTPTTAGMVVLARHLGEPLDADACAWLLKRHSRRGGFAAARGVPVADLLSTATALHALSLQPGALDSLRQPCLRFLDSVWNEKIGGFFGHTLDRTVDCEYTWYGLLALGHLSAPAATTVRSA